LVERRAEFQLILLSHCGLGGIDLDHCKLPRRRIHYDWN
jgi:hypothetical protein